MRKFVVDKFSPFLKILCRSKKKIVMCTVFRDMVSKVLFCTKCVIRQLEQPNLLNNDSKI